MMSWDDIIQAYAVKATVDLCIELFFLAVAPYLWGFAFRRAIGDATNIRAREGWGLVAAVGGIMVGVFFIMAAVSLPGTVAGVVHPKGGYCLEYKRC